jgi:hypothetical protein
MWTFAIFPILLFFAAAFMLTGLPVAGVIQNYFNNRGRRSVKCPDADVHGDVVVDHSFAFKSAVHSGHPEMRVASCSRWPEAGNCGQECLAQIEATTENLERLLAKTYAGKDCAICSRPLTPNDWRQSRVAVLNADNKLFELKQLGTDKLQIALENKRPICWACHQEQRARQAGASRQLVTV